MFLFVWIYLLLGLASCSFFLVPDFLVSSFPVTGTLIGVVTSNLSQIRLVPPGSELFMGISQRSINFSNADLIRTDRELVLTFMALVSDSRCSFLHRSLRVLLSSQSSTALSRWRRSLAPLSTQWYHFPVMFQPLMSIYSSPSSRQRKGVNIASFGKLGFPLLGLSLLGPLRFSSWPISTDGSPSCIAPRPRSVSIKKFIKPGMLLSRHDALLGRVLLSRLVSSSVQVKGFVDHLQADLNHLQPLITCWKRQLRHSVPSPASSYSFHPIDLNPPSILRSAQFVLQIQIFLMLLFFDMSGRGLHPYLDSTLKLCLCGDILEILEKCPHTMAPCATLASADLHYLDLKGPFVSASSFKKRAMLPTSSLLRERSIPPSSLLRERSFPPSSLLRERSIPPSSLLRERTFPPISLSLRGKLCSISNARDRSTSFTVLSSCVAVHTGPEDATALVSMRIGGKIVFFNVTS